jgi:hypothetical protein
LIRTHGSIEKIIENLDSKKFTVPEDWPYEYARRLFVKPEITEPADVEVCPKNLLVLNDFVSVLQLIHLKPFSLRSSKF